MKQTISQKIVELARDYKELSQKHYGWKTAYIIEGQDFISEESFNNIYRFYFSSDGDHCSIEMDGIEVAFFDPEQVEMPAPFLDSLEEKYLERLKFFERVKKAMESYSKNKEQDEKKQVIEALKLRIAELEQ